MARPLVIGMAGGTGSGKTTLSLKLAERLSDYCVLVMHQDRYFKDVRPHMTAPITGEDWEDHNHPDSLDLPQMVIDLDAHLSEEGHQVIIAEGLMMLHYAPLRERLDLGVFIDAPADERIVRRLRRNLARDMAFDDIAQFYLDSVRFRHTEYVEPSRWHADIVLNGSYPSERGLDVLVDWIVLHMDDARS